MPEKPASRKSSKPKAAASKAKAAAQPSASAVKPKPAAAPRRGASKPAAAEASRAGAAAPKVAAKTKSGAKKSSPKADQVGLTVPEILRELESLSHPKMRAIHVKNGSGENIFGAKLGDIRTIANRIKTNHELGLKLWSAGNIDAQLLATLVMKADQLTAGELEGMVESASFLQLADWLHSYVTKEHPDKESLRVKWMKSAHPMTSRAGWRLTAGRVVKSPEGLDLTALLDRIESEMPRAHPAVQWTMNECLAQIGIQFEQHRKRALAIGEKLGIYRDYPTPKGCTSPFAPIWIQAMVSRKG